MKIPPHVERLAQIQAANGFQESVEQELLQCLYGLMRLSVCSVTNIPLNADYLGMLQLCVNWKPRLEVTPAITNRIVSQIEIGNTS